MYNPELLEELKSLDLSLEPVEDVRRILTEMFQGGVPIMRTDYNYPKEIDRAVNNTEEEPMFSTKARISYKPQEYNKTHLRASTPDNTMFYASVIPEGEICAEEITNARIVGATEVIDLLRENIDGERLVTFGKWQVQDLISVITIFDPNKDYNVQYINDVRDKYNEQILSKDDTEKRDELLKFLAAEFSKKVENGENHNYMISSIFSELVVNNGADGVLYPSVQSDGNGLCLALHPRVMDRLKLTKVLQCKLTKSGDEALLNNTRNCLVEDGSDTFELN
jgi:hypothetical protein